MKRVPLHGKPQGFVTVEEGATKGAVFGVNVFWPDGTLVTSTAIVTPVVEQREADGESPSNSSTSQPSSSPSLWGLIVSVPANVQAVAGMTTAGFVRRDGAGAWIASPIVNADLSVATTSGLTEGSNLYYTDVRAAAAAPIQSIVAGTNVTVDVTDPANPVVNASGGALLPPINFTYGDASPAIILTVTTKSEVMSVSLQIEQAFDGVGAALSLGTMASPAELFSSAEVLPGMAATYEFSPRVEYLAGTAIVLTITPGAGATQGAGQLVISAIPSS